MGEGVSFNEDENLGLPMRKGMKRRGIGLSGLVMKLGLAKTQKQVDIVLLVVLAALIIYGAYVIMTSGESLKKVQHAYDPTDPAVKSMTHQPKP